MKRRFIKLEPFKNNKEQKRQIQSVTVCLEKKDGNHFSYESSDKKQTDVEETEFDRKVRKFKQKYSPKHEKQLPDTEANESKSKKIRLRHFINRDQIVTNNISHLPMTKITEILNSSETEN